MTQGGLAWRAMDDGFAGETGWAWPWLGGVTGTDGELLLRSGSVLELSAGLRQLSVMAERYVAELDGLSAAEIAGRSLSAAAVPADLREHAIRQLGGFNDLYRQRVQAHLDQLDPDSLGGGVTDPLQWMAAQAAGLMETSMPEGAGRAGRPAGR
jgi:hypothetical protein